MDFIGQRLLPLVVEGRHAGVIERVLTKDTQRGRFQFLVLRTSAAPHAGQIAEFLVPRKVHRVSTFYEFLLATWGDSEDEFDSRQLTELIGIPCSFEVKHVEKNGTIYANAVEIFALEDNG